MTVRDPLRRGPMDGPAAPDSGGVVRVGVAEVLGVPLLPPSRVVGVGNRLRAGLARLHRATAPPPARIIEAALGTLDLAALAALCRLDVPDRLVGPTGCAALADDLGVDRVRLERLLRYAAVTEFLRRDHPGGWRAWIEFASGPEVHAAIGALDLGLAEDADAFAAVNGASFFAWMGDRPDRHAAFDAAMAAGGQMHGLLIARALDWSDARRVCDVGGGDGALLSVLLAEHEQLDGVVFELPAVAARVRARPRLDAVGGDAFAAVPSGFDTYLLVNVLHDWDDAAAERLLGNVARALGSGDQADDSAQTPLRRVVIVESEAHERPRDDLAIRADLLMLALTPGGRERTVEELVALGSQAGLRRQQVRRLASGDVALVLVAEGI